MEYYFCAIEQDTEGLHVFRRGKGVQFHGTVSDLLYCLPSAVYHSFVSFTL